MLKQVRFDHIACALSKISDCFTSLRAVQAYAGICSGADFARIPRKGGDDSTFRGGQWMIGQQGVLEVLEPRDTPNNVLHRFLEKRGPGLHHVTFVVPSLKDAISNAKDHGYEGNFSGNVLMVQLSVKAWRSRIG